MSGVSAKTIAAIKTPKDLSSLSGSVKSRFLGRVAENPRLIANLDFSKNVSELSKVSPDIELLAASAKVNAKQAGEVRSVAFSATLPKNRLFTLPGRLDKSLGVLIAAIVFAETPDIFPI